MLRLVLTRAKPQSMNMHRQLYQLKNLIDAIDLDLVDNTHQLQLMTLSRYLHLYEYSSVLGAVYLVASSASEGRQVHSACYIYCAVRF